MALVLAPLAALELVPDQGGGRRRAGQAGQLDLVRTVESVPDVSEGRPPADQGLAPCPACLLARGCFILIGSVDRSKPSRRSRA